MPTTFHGIPGGGLFNEIYDAHIEGRTTRTEYVSDIRPEELYDPVAAAAAKEQASNLRPRTVTRPKYVTIPAAEKEYGTGERIWHIIASMIAMMLYILFIAQPVSESLPPGTFARVAVSGSAFVVWWGVYVLLKKRWMKKAAKRNPGMVRVVDGTEKVTQWVEDSSATTRNQPAAVGKASAQRAHKRRKVATTLYPSLRQDKKWVDKDELQDQMCHLKNYMDSTGNVPDWVNKDVAGFERIFGAACEVSTARSLSTVPGATVFNDIVLRNHGKVSANIDHLVYRNGAVVMADAKWWSQAPTFVSDRAGGVMVAENSPHKRTVSTCVYEASFLPAAPKAIVFSVRGRAARELQSPKVVERFHKFVPYEDGSQGVEVAPCPVVFVANNHVGEVVDAVLSGGGYVGGVYVPSGSSRDVDERELSRLECTEGLVFGL